jgi:uncharacterized protein (TIGR04255 family)
MTHPATALPLTSDETSMSTSHVKILHPPIVEALLDVDCDMPPAFDLDTVQKPLSEAFQEQYPKFHALFLEEARIEQKGDQPIQVSTQHRLQGFQFLKEDEKQLVQTRVQGFTFNRLAPYTSLDDYLPEIKRAWGLFVTIVAPIQIRVVRLRYINRIVLPLTDGRVTCEDYLKVGPRIPDEDGLRLASFLNQYTAMKMETGDLVNTVLTSQPPENNGLPILLDICVTSGTHKLGLACSKDTFITALEKSYLS